MPSPPSPPPYLWSIYIPSPPFTPPVAPFVPNPPPAPYVDAEKKERSTITEESWFMPVVIISVTVLGLLLFGPMLTRAVYAYLDVEEQMKQVRPVL
jgi:hypothetical protein